MKKTTTTPAGANMVLVTDEKLNHLLAEVTNLKEALIKQQEHQQADEYITSSVARKMLGLCMTTWQKYRDEKIIPFYQVGRKIYVKRSELDEFMNQHKIDRRA